MICIDCFLLCDYIYKKRSKTKLNKKENNAKLLLFSENISTFAMCDLRYYDYGARLKRTQKELLNLK